MKRIYEKAILASALKDFPAEKFFNTPDLDFCLLQYQKGEYITDPLKESEYLQFIAQGSVSIFYIKDDGTKYELNHLDGFYLLGDSEFFRPDANVLYAEAEAEVLCLGISLKKYREQLKQDCKFLYALNLSLSEKLALIGTSEGKLSSLSERVLQYMQYHCPDGILYGIEKSALRLHCSSRHLQRTLNTFEKDGTVIKCGKGKYQLLER